MPPQVIPILVESMEVSSSLDWSFSIEPTTLKETVLLKKTKKKSKKVTDSNSQFKFL